jgi:hypothetical protein
MFEEIKEINMKRRFLIPSLAAFITLAILFIGCAQPTDTTVTTGTDTPLVKLSDPVVRVTPYEGFNVISWEPVPDAKDYTVWRTDTESSSQIKVDTTAYVATSNLSIIDNVTDSGQKLANGRAYKYIVVASPAASRLDRSGLTAQEDVYSGKGEFTVVANIPDPATYKVHQASGITYRLDPDGMLYVSWTQPANAKATVGYFPGGYPADAAGAFEAFLDAPSGAGYLYADLGAGYLYPRNAVSATFPFIGGKGTIAIQTEYFVSGTIYAKDRPATVDIVGYDQYNLDLVWKDFPGSTEPDLKATHIYNVNDATTGNVQLTWSRIKGDEDVYSGEPYSTGADTQVIYNVYKREIGLNQDGISSVKVSSDWSKVDYERINVSDDRDSYLDLVYAKETGAVKSFLGTWQYMVFASTSNGASYSYPLTADLIRTLPDEATIYSAVVEYGGTAYDDRPYTNKIVVQSLRDGVSYKLYRGVLDPILIESNNYNGTWWVKPDDLEYGFTVYDSTPVHAWEGLSVTAAADTNANIYDTGIVDRKIYIYKLVSSVGDTFLGDGSVKPVIPTSTADRATVYSHLNFSVIPLEVHPERDGYTANQKKITARLSNDGYSVEGMTAKLFYRIDTANPSIIPGTTEDKWTEFGSFGTASKYGSFSLSPLELPTSTSPYPAASTFRYDTTYEFKAVAYGPDGKPIPNLDSSTYAGADIVDAIVSSRVSKSDITTMPYQTLSAAVTSDATQTISGIRGNYLNGLRIDVRIVASSSYQTFTSVQSTPIERTATFGTPSNNPVYDYKVDIRFPNVTVHRPAPTQGPGDTAVTYYVEYKYPWEETWADARQIGGTISY